MRSNALATALLFAAVAPCQTFFPPAPTPPENPLTTQKAYLGCVLFHEEQLSTDNTTACKSCHHFTTGGADARAPLSNPGYDGVYGTADDVIGSQGVPARDTRGQYAMTAHGFQPQVTPRKAPSIINVAYADRLFYDGRARSGAFTDPITGVVMASGATALENLILQPPVNPVEMGHPGRTWTDVVTKLAASQPLRLADQIPARISQYIQGASYPMLFQRAFGTPDVTPTRVAFAIASYLRTLVADQTRYDYALGGSTALTPLEQQGQTLFETRPNSTFQAAPCTQCHGDVTRQSHTAGPGAQGTTMYGQAPSGNFHNTGVRPLHEDQGSAGFTGQATDAGRFKVPMLRNIALHQNFFHNGEFTSLDQVVDFYSRGGDFHQGQAFEIQARNFTAQEKAALVAFLNTLTDPRVQAGVAPFDTMRLASERGDLVPTVVGQPSTGGGQHVPLVIAQEPVFLGTPKVTIGVTNIAANSWIGLLVDPVGNANGTDVLGVQVYLGGGATQLIALGVAARGLDGQGYFSTSFQVPNLPQLAGSTVAGQWLSLDPTAQAGLSASAGLNIRL